VKTEELFANTVYMTPENSSENCLPVGTRLSDFEIQGILGEGGFGIVYVAFDHSLQRKVALKEYMPGTLSGRAPDGSVMVRAERHREAFDAGLKSFINEARLLAQFDHPSLVKVYRFWEQNKTAYMVMRFYDGQTLKDIVQNRPEIVTEAWLKFIFKQILEALDTLYKAKVLHRDVSPDNIIVQRNGDAVLLDFGSARQIIGDMTQGLTVILKPGYAPVEQYSDDASMEQGPWTDIYALAAVMYFAIAKNPPVTSVARMIKDTLVMLQDGTHVGFSYKFLVAIDKGLAVQPQDRPQTMDEFRRLLGIAAFSSSRNARSSRSGKNGTSAEASKDGEPLKTLSRTRRSEQTQTLADKPVSRQALIGAAITVVLMLLGLWYWFKPADPAGAAVPPDAASVAASAQASALVPSATVGGSDVKPTSTPTPTPAAVSVAASGVGAAGKPASDSASSAQAASAAVPPAKVAASAALASPPASAVTSAANAAPVTQASASAAVESAAAKVDEVPPPLTLQVRFGVKPWGTVWVDGKQVGVSPPMKRFVLPEGKHQIKISNPAFPDVIKEVEVKPGKKRLELIDVDFTAAGK
jgi:serine/threonine protein kinase